MQLSFKTLNKQNFTIDAEPTETIGDLKKKIAESQSMSSAAMKLIHSGKIMADEKAVEFYNVKDTDQIICMVQKPKAAPVASAAPAAAAAAPSTPAPIAAQTPSAPVPAAPSSTQNAPATPSPAPAQTARSGGPGGLTMGPEREAAIANLEAMGFERPQVERAMRAAFFNPDRAVEYLLSGIPENVEREQADRLTNRAPQATPPVTAAGDAPAAQNDDEEEPVNLFEAAAAARGGSGGNTAGQPATRGVNSASSLDALRDNPMFHQLRTLVQQNPQMLESILQQVAASNPDLARAIQSNPDQFIQLLSEGGPEGEMGEMGAMPPGATPVAVTEAERDAIERLCRLGFQRDLAIQAYFACDKNEELAANFLFDHGEEDEE